MSIEKTSYGFMPDGKEVFKYLLDNGKNVKAEIITLGGTVTKLFVKDKNGEFVDVVLGFDSFEGYKKNGPFFGTLVGRCANRIKDSKFSINGNEYNVGTNDGKHSLHGGCRGFDKYVWNDEVVDNKVRLTMTSPDGDEGYPGKLDVAVTYELSEDDNLIIRYEAETDKETVVNLTNHSYFNLNGAGDGTVYDHILEMNSSFYTPADDDCVTTGEIASVDGTPFDFRNGRKIGDAINTPHPHTAPFGGFDNNFIIDGRGIRKFAKVLSEKTGITMELYSDAPGVQLYTANKTKVENGCKEGKKYLNHSAFCLETQNFPNAVNYSHFPSPILKPGEKYEYTAEHRFYTEK